MLSHKKKSSSVGVYIFQQTFNHLADYLLSKQHEVETRQPATTVYSVVSMTHVNPSQEIQTAVYARLTFEAKFNFKPP